MVHLASHHDVTLTPILMPVYPSIADTLRKLLCKYQVNLTNSSRVTAIFVPASQFLLPDTCKHNVYTTRIYLWFWDSCSGSNKCAPGNLQDINSFSLEQNSSCSCRQVFIHYCGLHQVWGRTEKTAPYMGSKRFYEHAQNLLGGVKKEVAIIELRGQKGCYIVKSIILC